jgi:hypothetical protein
MSTVGIDHFLAIAAIVVTSILVLLCFTQGKSGGNASEGDSSQRICRKKEFTLPAVGAIKEDDTTNAESLRVFDRLALTRSNGCVVTLSIANASSSDASVWKVVDSMMKVANVFLIIKAMNTEEEEAIWDQIHNVNKLSLEKHRVVFHETSIGKVAIVRQLRPQLHVDFDSDCCGSVAPHIRSVVEFKSVRGTTIAGGVEAPTTSLTADGKGSWNVIQCLEDVLSITLPPASKSSR